jgi:demethylmenaquinone methyltransferase/2-methoxy-6-polyprenyl-1,4-benzoquinol methylase
VESKFYSPDQHRAEKVHELFATIARRYDLLNDIMSAGQHRRWKRRLVELAGNPRDVLDLCCGTGDLALYFLRRSREVRVVGVDFTMEMLRVANNRDVSMPWIQADALRLPFADDAFDVVSVGFGLRNLADIDRGLREILRVLRPGGKLLSLDFGKPEWPAWRRIYFAYLGIVLPVLGRFFCGDPDTHAYILASLRDYPAQRGIASLMETCGFCECGFEEYSGGAMAINFGSKPR